jgi:hypothetical protein
MSHLQAEVLERLTRSAHAGTGRVRVRSALNPALWLCGIVSISSFSIGAWSSGAFQTALFVVGCAPISLVIGAFIYFMIRDPDRLQSEDYLIQQRALTLIQEKGGKIPISPTSIEVIANPYAKQISAGSAMEGE